MFPPEAGEEIPLENCVRVYPHQQNTGGFFIAALEKLGDIRAKPETETKSGNKDWIFTKPEIPTKTAFTETIDEITNGHDDQPVQPVEAPSDSAAARQNDSSVDASVGSKRTAPEEDGSEQSAKKQKTDDAPSEQDVATVEGGPEIPVPVEVKNAVKEAPFRESLPAQAIPTAKRRRDEVNEESFKYLSPDHPELLKIYNFYELHQSFPRDRFLVRNPAGDPVKGIYYSSQLIKDILIANDGRGMKFVHAGVKMFMKQDAQGQDICRWRIQTEGLPIVEGWVGEDRVVRLRKKSTLRKLLVEMFPKITTTKHDDGTETGGWKDLGEIGEQVCNIGGGCCVLRVDTSPDDEEDGFKEALTLPLWRSMHSVNLMLPKEDRRAMLLRIYNEDVELVNHTDAKHNGGKGSHEGKGKAPAEEPKGSVNAQADAEELKQRIKDNDDSDDSEGGVAVAADPPTDLDVMAMEEDMISAENEVHSKRLEVLEDGDRKVAEAMPERAGDEAADVAHRGV
jgi:multisite-specific tRNA:(cytosine-C5)-methyltransferase